MNQDNQEERKVKQFGAKPPASDSDSSGAEYEMVQADAEFFNQNQEQKISDDEALSDQLSKDFAGVIFNGKRKKGFKPIKDICKRDKPIEKKFKSEQNLKTVGTEKDMLDDGDFQELQI